MPSVNSDEKRQFLGTTSTAHPIRRGKSISSTTAARPPPRPRLPAHAAAAPPALPSVAPPLAPPASLCSPRARGHRACWARTSWPPSSREELLLVVVLLLPPPVSWTGSSGKASSSRGAPVQPWIELDLGGSSFRINLGDQASGGGARGSSSFPSPPCGAAKAARYHSSSRDGLREYLNSSLRRAPPLFFRPSWCRCRACSRVAMASAAAAGHACSR